jgi:hypothetical protein
MVAGAAAGAFGMLLTGGQDQRRDNHRYRHYSASWRPHWPFPSMWRRTVDLVE